MAADGSGCVPPGPTSLFLHVMCPCGSNYQTGDGACSCLLFRIFPGPQHSNNRAKGRFDTGRPRGQQQQIETRKAKTGPCLFLDALERGFGDEGVQVAPEAPEGLASPISNFRYVGCILVTLPTTGLYWPYHDMYMLRQWQKTCGSICKHVFSHHQFVPFSPKPVPASFAWNLAWDCMDELAIRASNRGLGTGLH